MLKQIDLPHSYYFREMYLPQLTSGPSGVDFSPDGGELVYSMGGSLWRQKIGEVVAVELTHGPGYDYQPEWSPDGRHIVFARHDRNAIELQRLDLGTLQIQPLTKGGAVNVEPRYSPDGKQLAYVSTEGSGHFNLFVAEIGASGLSNARAAVTPRESKISRYYYSSHDHAINPSWTPDGARLAFVSNREVAYGSGSLCSVALDGPADLDCFAFEETSWRANPQVAPDGRRVLYSSYHGRQWHQLWLTTLPRGAKSGQSTAPLPLTFGEFDVTHARWSPDGRRIAYVSNEDGNVSLWVQEAVGGKRREVIARERRYRRPMHEVRLAILDASGARVPARVSVLGSDGRHYAPAHAWTHADDGFDPARQSHETHYFFCDEGTVRADAKDGEGAHECILSLPAGDAHVTVWRGHAHRPVEKVLHVREPTSADITLQSLPLPDWAPRALTADMHVHMNYGGHYRHGVDTLIDQARAEDVDVVYNTIVNKEQRIPDIAEFRREPARRSGVTVYQAQEYHTSLWGHLGLLHLDEHLLLPDFSAYQNSALTSPYPHNAAIADLAHAQNAVIGYVHPYDWRIQPLKEKALTHAFPADVALGKVDYFEVVAFSDHKATAEVWHRLLNLGFRVPAGAGTDAMANYASLRGPVGLNRVYIHAGDDSPNALRLGVKQGRTVASNGPQLALQLLPLTLSPAPLPSRERGEKRMHRPAHRAAPTPSPSTGEGRGEGERPPSPSTGEGGGEGERAPSPSTGEGDRPINIGDVVRLERGEHRVRYRAAMRSPVPIDHLELLQNGRVVATHRFGKDRTIADLSGELVLQESGWVALRAWSDEAHPLIFDLYPYATTSPIYIEVEGSSPRSPEDAAYFVSWLDRVLAAAEARDDYNDERERRETLEYLRAAREVFRKRLE